MKHVSQSRSASVTRERTDVAERVLRFLRERYPIKLAENVAADIGVSAATVRKWIERGSAPSLALFGRLTAAYGPEFLHAIYGWSWLDAAARAQRDQQIAHQITAYQQRIRKLQEDRAR